MNVPQTSRYKDTPSFQREDGVGEMFGLWRVPVEFQEQASNSLRHVTKGDEIGFLDILAARYYGFGYEHLWWVIAVANGIVDVERDMKVGMTLRIPPRDLVMSFVGRAGNVTV